MVEFTDFENKRQVRYFISESQTGIGSSIAVQVHNGYKFLGGKLAYAAVSLKHIFTFSSKNFAISVDEKPEQNRKLIGIAIGNGNLTAGGMKLTPEASPCDGKLDALFIHPMGVWKRLVNFWRIYTGNHIHNPNFSYLKCSQISIRSEKPVYVSADGELLGTTPFTIKINPQLIKVITNYT
jgi:diacylglycerol kinase family enzyme